MSACIKEELWSVIDEMNSAYEEVSSHECLNADYAEYAGLAIERFRKILGNPALEEKELEIMLRQGITQCKAEGTEEYWKECVVARIEISSNQNSNHA